MTLRRGAICRILRDHLPPDALVIGGLGTASRAWREIEAPQPTYYASDPMGMGTTMALGLALAQPTRTIFYLGGDGDLAMSLGSLLTIAGAGVRNLKIAIFDNGRYETGGGQPLSAAGKASLAALAAAAGFPWSRTLDDEDTADDRIAAFFATAGLAFLALPVAAEASPYGPPPRWSQAEDRAVFMRRLAGDI